MAATEITKSYHGDAGGGRAIVTIRWERITVMAGIKDWAFGFSLDVSFVLGRFKEFLQPPNF